MTDPEPARPDPDGWLRVRAVFDQVVDLAGAARADALDRLTSADPVLRSEVEALLAAAEEAGDRFERAPRLSENLGDGDLPPGARVGPYRIIREAGRGGMGAVYEAVRSDEAFTKRVAIKMVSHGRGTDAMLRRFRHERQILARLQHKNIAALLDGGVAEDGRPYFAMEFVEGEPIDRYCDQRRLPLADRLQLMRQVCAAVHYAHQVLVVHRDLKPSNVMVGPDGTVKLLDFGIAKLLESTGGDEEELTEPGQLPMTTNYASPEQIRGEPVTTATDVYSLGVLLYRLVAGRLPYRVDQVPFLEARHRILETTPDPPSQARSPDAPPVALPRASAGELDQIVLMAIRKEPERRYRSAEQLSEDLHRLLAGFPIHAQPDSLRYRAGKFIRRNRGAVVAAAVAFLALGGGLGTALWQMRVGQRERSRTQVVNGFLQDVLISTAGNAGQAPGDSGSRSVAEALDAASRRLETEQLDGRPEVKATLEQIIGSSYLRLGRNADAERHLRAALAIEERLYGDDNPETLATLTSLAQLAVATADYDAADGFFTRRLTALRREVERGGIAPSVLAGGLSDYALVRRARGDAAGAEALWREALGVARRMTRDSLGTTGTLEALLALSLLDGGKFEEAERRARDLVAEFRRRARGDSPDLCTGLTLLGSTLLERGKLAEALANLREGEGICRRLYDPDYLPIYDNLRLQAQANLLAGHYPEAERQVDSTLVKYRSQASPKYISYATALTVQGLVYAKTGRLAEGERVLRQAVAHRAANMPPGHFMAALTKGALGEVLTAAGRYPEAEALLVESYRALRASQAVDNERLALARARLAEWYRATGRAVPDSLAR